MIASLVIWLGLVVLASQRKFEPVRLSNILDRPAGSQEARLRADLLAGTATNPAGYTTHSGYEKEVRPVRDQTSASMESYNYFISVSNIFSCLCLCLSHRFKSTVLVCQKSSFSSKCLPRDSL